MEIQSCKHELQTAINKKSSRHLKIHKKVLYLHIEIVL